MSIKLRFDHRVVFAGACIVVAVTTLCLCGIGAGYSCGSADGGHCYGTTTFPIAQIGVSGFWGFATQLTSVPLHSGNGELNNEIWVVQSKNTACGLGNRCWIEIGVTAGAYGLPSNETHIFWADNRPHGGFNFHDQGALKPQELNHQVFVMIRPRSSELNAFDVDAQTCADVSSNGSTCQRWIIAKSTKNSMVASEAFMGMELSGSGGASAGNANFTETVFLDPSAPFGGRYTASAGISTLNVPVNAGWTATPSSSNFGGTFFTGCCQSTSARSHSPTITSITEQAKAVEGKVAPLGKLSVKLAPSGPRGSPAITARTAGTQAFSIDDAKRYVTGHQLPMSLGKTGKAAILKAEFMTSKEVGQLLSGMTTGFPDDYKLCYVEFEGPVTFVGPPGSKVTYNRGVLIFDAHTGNLVIRGGKP
jgi:hypothetical protein